MRFIAFLSVIFSIFLCLSNMPSHAQNADDPCHAKCSSAGYNSGHISEDGNGECDKNEDVVETICCCSPKK